MQYADAGLKEGKKLRRKGTSGSEKKEKTG